MKMKLLSMKIAKFFVLPALLAVSLLTGLFLMSPTAFAEEYENVVDYNLGVDGGYANPFLSFEEGWNAAISEAKENEEAHVRVNLFQDWNGTEGALGEGEGFKSGAIYIPEGVNITLDLNGHVIDRNVTEQVQNEFGSVVIVDGVLEVTDKMMGMGVVHEILNDDGEYEFRYTYSNAKTPVYDGIITGGNTQQGGGVYVREKGKLILTSGSIHGNSADVGGGVYVSGEFEMNGGAIIANAASENGGGVYVAANSEMRLQGSQDRDLGISYNTAKNGGGIYVDGSAAFTDGTVSYNTAEKGGGFYLAEGGEVKANGGFVKNNVAELGGGGGAYAAGNLFVSGSFYLADNNYVYEIPVEGDGEDEDENEGENEGEGEQEYEQVAQPNNLYLVENNVINVTGAFTEYEAKIDVYAESGVLTRGYEQFNTVEEIPYNPARVFSSDFGHYVLLNRDGEVQIGTKDADPNVIGAGWEVTVSSPNDNHIEEVEYAFRVTYDAAYEYSIGLPIADEPYAPVKFKDAGTYPVFATVGGVEVKFTLIIDRVMFDEGVNIFLSDADDKYPFEGRAITPTVTVMCGSDTLEKDKDYTLTYVNNINVGTATVTVQGVGNYVGEKTLTFSIIPTDGEYTISWQYRNNGSWTTFYDDGENKLFVFDGITKEGDIRARLDFVGEDYGYTTLVYAEGFEESGALDSALTLKFTIRDGAGKIADVGTYGVSVELKDPTLESNLRLPQETTVNVTISPRAVSISPDDFVDGGEGARLWMLQFSDGGAVTYSELRSRATYVVGDKLVVGDKDYYYARYRGGEALSLVLNPQYRFKEDSLDSFLGGAQIRYEYTDLAGNPVSTAGAAYEETVIVAKATITLNENFIVEGGSRSITLTKEWAIVSINNAFLNNATGGAFAIPNRLTYGISAQNFTAPPRPEHGYRVDISLKSEGKAVSTFTVQYISTTSRSYNLLDNDGKLIEGTFQELLSGFLREQGVGSYALEVSSPEYRATGSHTHWWDGSQSSTEDDQVVYYAISMTYSFTVVPKEIMQNGGNGITVSFTPATSMSYTGEELKPLVTITDSGIELQEGKDFVVEYGNNIDCGTASIRISGLGNYTGTPQYEFAIVPAKDNAQTNQALDIGDWKFGAYDREINYITSSFKYGSEDVYYSIARQDGTPVEGLEKIVLEEGLANQAVADILSSLPCGEYILRATIDETSNYNGATAQTRFRIFQATNYWDITPSVSSWVKGKYAEEENIILVQAHFGNAVITVTDTEGNVYYNSADGTNVLNSAKPGLYFLTASVEGTEDYAELVPYTFTFEVFEPAGLPWWVTLVIVVGVLAVVAAVLAVLHAKGVLQLLSGKMVIAIRAKATIDATIAAVQARKKEEEAEARARAKEQSQEQPQDDNSSEQE